MSDYDIIGDIHGQADKLTELLEILGYEQHDGVYQRPDSKVVFLGDRGPYNRRVIDIVRPGRAGLCARCHGQPRVQRHLLSHPAP